MMGVNVNSIQFVLRKFFKTDWHRQTLKSGAMGSQSASAKPAHARGSRHSVITEPFARPGSSASSSRAVRACEDLLEQNHHKFTNALSATGMLTH